jgi:hypothetical protein
MLCQSAYCPKSLLRKELRQRRGIDGGFFRFDAVWLDFWKNHRVVQTQYHPLNIIGQFISQFNLQHSEVRFFYDVLVA